MIRADSRLFAPRLPRLSQVLALWSAVARQRNALARLDDAALADIGISRSQAQNEAARPFWDAPDNWRI